MSLINGEGLLSGAVVEWLKWLGYGAESRGFEAGLRHATIGKFSVHPAVKCSELGKNKAAKREG